MKKNLKGGKKFKKGKKENNDNKIIFRETSEGEEYGKVIKLLGNGRLYCKLKDGTEQLCIIPGKMKKKKIWVRMDSIVLIAIRDYQPDKGDIIHVYSPSQIEILKKNNELPINFYENYNEDNNNEDSIFIGDNEVNTVTNFNDLESIPESSITINNNNDDINLEDI